MIGVKWNYKIKIYKIKIMISSKITYKSTNECYIDWTDQEGQFGTIRIKYNDKGGFDVDAEYIGIMSMLKIIQAVNLDQ